MAKTDYQCRSCIYYLDGMCKHSGEYRTTKPGYGACVNFECVDIKI